MDKARRIADALLALADVTEAYAAASHRRSDEDDINLAHTDWKNAVAAAAIVIKSRAVDSTTALGLLPPHRVALFDGFFVRSMSRRSWLWTPRAGAPFSVKTVELL